MGRTIIEMLTNNTYSTTENVAMDKQKFTGFELKTGSE